MHHVYRCSVPQLWFRAEPSWVIVIQDLVGGPAVRGARGGREDWIDLDLVQCEMFASSEPVPGMEEGVLVMCFSDLRQLLDLFVSWDWSTYFADFGKSDSSRYVRVQPAMALVILDKLKEADKKNSRYDKNH